MSDVTMKSEADIINGTPEKRMFWSIISDYDLKTGICELIDNAIDIWVADGHPDGFRIAVYLDVARQMISVIDNAGGVKREDLRLLIVPGGSKNEPSAHTIGIFGVGSKRASIALGEHVEIKTRFKKEDTYQIDINRDWLGTDDWHLPSYQIPPIEPGTTRIEISNLRRNFSRNDVDAIHFHLGQVYSDFINKGCSIILNRTLVSPIVFDNWSYPPGQAPQRAIFKISPEEGVNVSVDITAGLINDRVADQENYGVYFYCNRRLIVKEFKSREVGYFVTSEAGVPHPDASLCRAIVSLSGPASAMPWNSSKSDLNFSHPVFMDLRPTLIQLVSHFSSLSRRLKDDWDRNVFLHKVGTINQIEAKNIVEGRRLVLPPLPIVRRQKIDKLKTANRSILKKKPWLVGLVEAIGAVDIISRQKFDTKNRMSLILLDSNVEISFKEFIVHRADLFIHSTYTDDYIRNLFKNRRNVVSDVCSKISIPKEIIDNINHYYNLRNKLIHERATVGVTDSDIITYKNIVERLMSILFGIKSK